MATINSSKSPQSSSAPWFKLVVTEVTSSAPATKAKLSYSFYYMTEGYATDSIARPYSISINGSTVKTGSATVANITRSETLITSGTVDVDRTDATKSVAISFTVAWQVYWSGTYKASHDGSGSISISPKTYTVTYNANSGSGAPSAQTKTGGVTLTLSSTKPTRTGYSFLNWNTKSDGSGSKYASGGSYTTNAAVTLYAQWDPIKYSVVYDTNGGTGVIEQQTKIYGTTLQLTTTKPSRAYYDFINWCTDPNGLGDVYESGDVYTGNANLKLYAIWALAYVPPKISNITAVRCLDSSGSVEDPYQGTYARIEFDWECDQNLGPNPAVITIAGESISTGESYSGHVQYTIARTQYSPELSYSISIVVQDNYEATRSSISLTTSEYCIDFKAGGKGVCVGGVATKDRTFECKWPAEFSGAIKAGGTIGGNYIQGRRLQSTAHTDLGEAPASYPVFNESGWIYHRTKDEMLSDLGYGDFADNIIFESGEQTDERSVRFKNSTGENTHNCTLYGGNPNSDTAIGLWDTKHGRRILAYLDNANDLKLGNDSCYITSERRLRTLAVSSGAYMNASQTITLSDKVSNQLNGIVIAWSYYNGSSGQNYDWNYTFIPKEHVLRHAGTGIDCVLGITDASSNVITTKYLYVADTTITGHSFNSSNANSAKFVLRYVYGV